MASLGSGETGIPGKRVVKTPDNACAPGNEQVGTCPGKDSDTDQHLVGMQGLYGSGLFATEGESGTQLRRMENRKSVNEPLCIGEHLGETDIMKKTEIDEDGIRWRFNIRS